MTWEQIMMVTAAIIPSVIIGTFSYRQSLRVDRRAAISDKTDIAEQIIDGFSDLAVERQKEIERLSTETARLEGRIKRLQEEKQELQEGSMRLMNRLAMLSNGKPPGKES